MPEMNAISSTYSTANGDPTGDGRGQAGLFLLVAMPALNEERTVGEVIRQIPRDIAGVDRVGVVVIDDGSTDSTAAKARQAGAEVVSHPARKGVGAAFHSALAHALAKRADLLVTIDSDGQFDPAAIPTLIEPLLAKQADFVTASRFKDPALVPHMPAVKKWGNRVMSKLISRIAGQRFYDVSCGMRAYNRESMMRLTLIGSFTYTQEVFLNLAFKGLRIAEVPVAVRGVREFGKSRVASNLWRYGVQTLMIIARSYRDYKPLQFFSRLAAICFVPGFLLSIFLAIHYFSTGAFTPHKWAAFTIGALGAGTVVFGLMGILGDTLNRHRVYLEEVLYVLRRDGTNGGSKL